MSIDRTDHDAVTVVTPDGERLDIAVASDFRNALIELIENGRRNLVVDLKGVSFIDSSGLGALVSALKTLKANGGNGDVRLAQVQEPVVALLEIIRLNRVFTTYASVENAVQSYQS